MNEPSAFSVSVPLAGPVTTVAVRVSPSASVSLPSTPVPADGQRRVLASGVGVVVGDRGVVDRGDGDGHRGRRRCRRAVGDACR